MQPRCSGTFSSSFERRSHRLYPSQQLLAWRAGISKSLVMSIDMPLLIPHPESTAIASYVASVSNMSIFSVEEDARMLARDTANFIKSQEGFLPVRVVEGKLINLGQSWKPPTATNGHKWAQVISAEDARTLSWVIPRPWPATPAIIEDSITTGNSRKATFSLVVADETMIFLEDRAAQTFCALLLPLRKKIALTPLSAAARMAGIHKSLVMSFDMPLCIPNPGSTAISAYISVVSGMAIFHQESEMCSLARDTVLAMRSQEWRPTAGLPVHFRGKPLGQRAGPNGGCGRQEDPVG
ncbi:hypothetical protein FPHYL_12999 [Fusarium phyllophilum]|uniref:Uncharacterized protein n=1 Tax=Fusarium phyllophilum TaxID=47803 RepID=A0A8H5IGG5_9HYPO|nr:hypothetical protein FPHYL_12999 [Fusarium phyllophilum]